MAELQITARSSGVSNSIKLPVNEVIETAINITKRSSKIVEEVTIFNKKYYRHKPFTLLELCKDYLNRAPKRNEIFNITIDSDVVVMGAPPLTGLDEYSTNQSMLDDRAADNLKVPIDARTGVDPTLDDFRRSPLFDSEIFKKYVFKGYGGAYAPVKSYPLRKHTDNLLTEQFTYTPLIKGLCFVGVYFDNGSKPGMSARLRVLDGSNTLIDEAVSIPASPALPNVAERVCLQANCYMEPHYTVIVDINFNGLDTTDDPATPRNCPFLTIHALGGFSSPSTLSTHTPISLIALNTNNIVNLTVNGAIIGFPAGIRDGGQINYQTTSAIYCRGINELNLKGDGFIASGGTPGWWKDTVNIDPTIDTNGSLGLTTPRVDIPAPPRGRVKPNYNSSFIREAPIDEPVGSGTDTWIDKDIIRLSTDANYGIHHLYSVNRGWHSNAYGTSDLLPTHNLPWNLTEIEQRGRGHQDDWYLKFMRNSDMVVCGIRPNIQTSLTVYGVSQHNYTAVNSTPKTFLHTWTPTELNWFPGPSFIGFLRLGTAGAFKKGGKNTVMAVIRDIDYENLNRNYRIKLKTSSSDFSIRRHTLPTNKRDKFIAWLSQELRNDNPIILGFEFEVDGVLKGDDFIIMSIEYTDKTGKNVEFSPIYSTARL